MDTSTNLTPTTSTTTSSTRRRPSARFESAAAAAPRTSRGLRVDQYSRANSGVWYYQIDIEFRRVVDITASSSTGLEPCAEDDVQYYAVKRRYNEFLQLYESIKIELAHVCEIKGYVGANDQLPPFPQKELISSSMLGLLWRMTSPMDVLEDRRVKFETLLRWIEAHPQLRECIAFTEFLGQPPQSSEGYVSLKEYSSQHWLSSLEQLTKAKAKRRRLSSDCSSCSVLQQERTRSAKKRRQDDRRGGNPSPSTSPTSRPKRRRLFAEVKRHSVVITTSPRKAKKRARASSTSSSSPHKDELSSTTHPLCLPCADADGERVAQVESSQVHKKRRSTDLHPQHCK